MRSYTYEMQTTQFNPEIEIPTNNTDVYDPSFIVRNRQKLGIAVSSMLIATGCFGGESPQEDVGDTTPTSRIVAEELPADSPAPPIEVDPDMTDAEFRDAFFTNVHDHPPRALCVVEIGDDTTRQFDTLLYGTDNRMDEVIAESPFSHWWSPATTDSQSNFKDYTTDQASVDVALDEDFADMPAGTNIYCDIDEKTGEVTYRPSNNPIYPKSIPSPNVVAGMVGNTFAVTSSAFANGMDIYTRTTGVHVGNGQVLAPWWSNLVNFPTRTKNVDAPAQNILLEGFDRPDTQLVDAPVDETLGSDLYQTDIQDMPEVSFGDYNSVKPGDTLIFSGFDRQVNSERGERFLYRVVVLDRFSDGRIVAATGVEDAGSYSRERYSTAGYDAYGYFGAGVYNSDGQLIGTAGETQEYDYGWDITYNGVPKDVDPADEPKFNPYIDGFHARLGLPTPRQLEEVRRASVAEANETEGNISYIARDLPAFDSIVFINPIPDKIISSPDKPLVATSEQEKSI